MMVIVYKPETPQNMDASCGFNRLDVNLSSSYIKSVKIRLDEAPCLQTCSKLLKQLNIIKMKNSRCKCCKIYERNRRLQVFRGCLVCIAHKKPIEAEQNNLPLTYLFAALQMIHFCCQKIFAVENLCFGPIPNQKYSLVQYYVYSR